MSRSSGDPPGPNFKVPFQRTLTQVTVGKDANCVMHLESFRRKRPHWMKLKFPKQFVICSIWLLSRTKLRQHWMKRFPKTDSIQLVACLPLLMTALVKIISCSSHNLSRINMKLLD